MSDLSELVQERLDALDVPPPDLADVHRRGHRIRSVRAVAAASAVVVVAVAVGFTASLAGGGGAEDRSGRDPQPIGRLDLSQGLRAYAAPGAEIHLGGRAFPGASLDLLDTDATATPAGVLFYDEGVPRLLAESGEVEDLEPDAEPMRAHPTAKIDSQGAVVAYGARLDGGLVVRVRDLASGTLLASRAVPQDTVVDGMDDGVVFLRTGEGTTRWDTATDEERPFAGPRTGVADVRNGVVLYDGPAPDGPDASAYRLVKGGIDAQLTYDGAYVVYWSSRLEPTAPGGAPLLLDAGSTEPGPTTGWWAIDTDGSVLTAVPGAGQTNEVYDCEVPAGTCADLGPLTTEHGDPMFIGVDM
jgi:hypothetical protein